MCFEFPFNLTGKLTMLLLTGQSWHVLKTWYTGGGPERGFWCCLAHRPFRCLVLSVAWANSADIAGGKNDPL